MKISTESFISAICSHKRTWSLDRDCCIGTYPELIQTLNTNVCKLEKWGFRCNSGQRLLIDVATGWRFVPLLLAALKKQVCVIPVDPKHNPIQFEAIRQQHKNALLITTQHIDCRGKLIDQVVPPSFLNSDLELEEVMLMLYTSGTTGHPKAVMLTPTNVWSNVSEILNYSELNEEGRILIIRPFTTASALVGELLVGLFSGCSFYIKERDRSPIAALRLIEEHRISVMCATSSIVAKLSSLAVRHNLMSLDRIVLSGEVLYDSQLDKIREAFRNVHIWNAYGLTEAAPRVSCLTDCTGKHAANCVGFPLGNVGIKIVDECGNTVPEGKSGELLISGPNVMKGYFHDLESTEKKIRQSWLYTADLAAIEDGRLHVFGRKDEVLNRCGNKVHPYEIETIIRTCPGVQDVIVIGEHSEMVGMKIYAFFEADAEVDESHLVKFMLKYHIDSRLCPDVFKKVSSLPRNEAGKLVRVQKML